MPTPSSAARMGREVGYSDGCDLDERGARLAGDAYVTGMGHSATSATASAFEETPWRAVQRAALAPLAQES